MRSVVAVIVMVSYETVSQICQYWQSILSTLTDFDEITGV